jgi:endonuclease/exonuclease/phosphatase family metal-dependent hydrolase
MRQLLAAVGDMQAALLREHGAAAVGATPVIVCGDWNCDPGSPAHAAATSHPAFRFRSAYALAAAGGGAGGAAPAAAPAEPAFTTWKYRTAHGGGAGGAAVLEKKACIDFVMANEAARIAPAAVWRLPTEAEIGPAALPSAQYGSDHLALGVTYTWLA